MQQVWLLVVGLNNKPEVWLLVVELNNKPENIKAIKMGRWSE